MKIFLLLVKFLFCSSSFLMSIYVLNYTFRKILKFGKFLCFVFVLNIWEMHWSCKKCQNIKVLKKLEWVTSKSWFLQTLLDKICTRTKNRNEGKFTGTENFDIWFCHDNFWPLLLKLSLVKRHWASGFLSAWFLDYLAIFYFPHILSP